MEVRLYKLKFLTPKGFRIGGGNQDTLEPLTMGGKYVIPASSLKGVLRRTSEIVCGHSPNHEEVDPKKVYEENSKNEEITAIARAKGVLSVERQKEFAELYTQYKCQIERLYGGDFFAGAISIADVTLDGEVLERAHSSMDRKKGKVLEKHLYTEKYLNVKQFEVKVVVRGNEAQECWNKTLKFLNEVGTFLGGGKSRGIGLLALDLEESLVGEVNGLTSPPTWYKLKPYLEGKKELK
ncbi:hypothetical protein GWK48_10545 [Metallosphaera tengchongensis]|uniref:CRISPR type III-associated protein domain-containing protein n=1 Tax=Metallosphaera tengchongensis TaxID=1532350 RepID=A0A6N0NZ00_9CREN|nr:RAMP superfamily CRISPR-associated protein [Metallosphaera tengchongensis]QKR00769.1 hypothetical protein GWK48_10545 [Metallosphaera tengchongensis]